jgi:putative SOS response-associated peptidase YedK
MCGRYVSPDSASIERQWQLRPGSVNPFAQRYNVAPTVEVPFLCRRDDGLALACGRWGLIPRWWKQAKPPRVCHDARLEEALAKPMWRDAMRGMRCLIPARGWYEWRESDQQPFYFHRRDGKLAAFAGIFSVFEGRMTCALLSSAAQGELARVHARMPLALADDAQQEWLLNGATAAAPQDIAFHPVRRRVNASRAEGPELIEPLAA